MHSEPSKYEESEDFYFDDPVNEVEKWKPLRLIRFLVIAALVVSGTYAANIAINAGGKSEFGQGLLKTIACDTQVKLTPKAAFNSATNSYKVSGFAITGIAPECENKVFTIRAFDSSTSTPLALYSYNGTTYTEVNVLFSANASQPGDGGIQGGDITSGSDFFEVILNGSAGSPSRVALASTTTVAKFTMQTKDGPAVAVLPTVFGGSLIFTTVRNGPWPVLDYSGSEFVFGTGDFTVELWANYPGITSENTQGNSAFYDAGGLVNDPGSFAFWIENSSVKIRVNGINDFGVAVNPAWVGNWVHYAAVRTNGVIKIYVNGVEQTLNQSANSDMAANIDRSTPRVGALAYDQWSDYGFFGKMSNLRVVKGRAVYTSNFTPSSSSLTAVPGTVLLLRADSSADATIDSSPYAHTPINVLANHALPTWNSAHP